MVHTAGGSVEITPSGWEEVHSEAADLLGGEQTDTHASLSNTRVFASGGSPMLEHSTVS